MMSTGLPLALSEGQEQKVVETSKEVPTTQDSLQYKESHNDFLWLIQR